MYARSAWRFLSALAIAAMINLTPAFAQTDAERDGSDAFELARTFAQCAGFWDFLSAAEQSLGNTASAQHAHNVSNGARISAGYMMSIRHRLEQPEQPPRAYGSWNDFIEPQAETMATSMWAALEREDTATVEAQAVLCRGMSEASETIVNEIRAELPY
jgi:hypothetical protein